MFTKNRRGDNLKCGCEKTVKKVKLVAATGCNEDEAAVAALPDHWIPKHGGTTLAIYQKEQEAHHKNTLQDLLQNVARINESIDNKIRALAEALLAHIQQNQREIDCIVEGCDTGRDPLTPAARNIALKQASQLYSARIKDILSFRNDSLSLEKERTEGMKNQLRDNFQRLVAVGHMTPKALLNDFDIRAYEINQQLLSNSRAYAELEAQLRLQAKESMVRAKSSLNQLCLGVTMNRRHSAYPWMKDKIAVKRPCTAFGSRRQSSELAEKSMNMDDYFNTTRNTEAYRFAVEKILSEVSGMLNDLNVNLGLYNHIGQEPITEISDLQDIIEKIILRKLSNNVNGKNTADLYEIPHIDMTSMQKSLWSLSQCLQDVYLTLYSAGHLSDVHMQRLALAQQLTMAVVEDLITTNDSTAQANEVAFNIALEQLRNTPDPEKLQLYYELLALMLDRTTEMYRSHHESELQSLNQFMNLVPTIVNTFQTEFNCFLEKHHKVPLQSMGSLIKQQSVPSSRCGAIGAMASLPRALLQTKLQELILQNLRNDFVDAFEHSMLSASVSDELIRQAQMWVNERSTAINARYFLNMASHSVRLERLNVARDSRLAELFHHEARLNSHMEAVFDLIERLPAGAAEFLNLGSSELYPLCNWVDRLQANVDKLLSQDPLDPEVKKLKMCSYAPRLVRYRKLFEDSLNLAFDARKQEVKDSVQETRMCNVKFMSQIKLFSEGGRYAPQEATKAFASLTRLADSLEACLSRTMDTLNYRRTHLLSLADLYIAPIHKIVEEYKPGNKGSQSKQKALLSKKKSKTKN